MKDQFFALTSDLFSEAGFGDVLSNDEGIVLVDFDTIKLTFAYVPAMKSALLHCTIGTIMGTKEEYQLLLQMNNIFSETGGACLGLFEDTVSLQMLIPLDGISQESYNEQALRFLEKLNEFLPYFDTPEEFYERAQSLASHSDSIQHGEAPFMLRI
ncbi:MAG: type III secretion system chaperone [Pseudomonadota bacterium]